MKYILITVAAIAFAAPALAGGKHQPRQGGLVGGLVGDTRVNVDASTGKGGVLGSVLGKKGLNLNLDAAIRNNRSRGTSHGYN